MVAHVLEDRGVSAPQFNGQAEVRSVEEPSDNADQFRRLEARLGRLRAMNAVNTTAVVGLVIALMVDKLDARRALVSEYGLPIIVCIALIVVAMALYSAWSDRAEEKRRAAVDAELLKTLSALRRHN